MLNKYPVEKKVDAVIILFGCLVALPVVWFIGVLILI